MSKIKDFLANPILFAVLYLALMLSTYFLPYLRSTVGIASVLAGSQSMFNGAMFFLVLQVVALALMAGITFIRGGITGRAWIVIFPILALVFDIVPILSLIPFVPTVMHIIAIVMGVQPGAARAGSV